MQVTYVLRPDWRYKRENNCYNFRLWISYQDERKDYQTVVQISAEGHEKLYTKNAAADIKEIRQQVKTIETDLENYLREISEFDFDISNGLSLITIRISCKGKKRTFSARFEKKTSILRPMKKDIHCLKKNISAGILLAWFFSTL